MVTLQSSFGKTGSRKEADEQPSVEQAQPAETAVPVATVDQPGRDEHKGKGRGGKGPGRGNIVGDPKVSGPFRLHHRWKPLAQAQCYMTGFMEGHEKGSSSPTYRPS